jgi:hypothetical protein
MKKQFGRLYAVLLHQALKRPVRKRPDNRLKCPPLSMIYSLALTLMFTGNNAFGQSPDNLIASVPPLDTITVKHRIELDSIQNSAVDQFSSVKKTYDSVMTVISEQSARLTREIDSLRNLNLQEDGLVSKLDSIEDWKDEKIRALTEKVEELKTSVTEKIKTLDLPPELEEKGRVLTTVMNELDVSLPDAGSPLALQDNLQIDLSGVENSLGNQSIPGSDNISLPETGLGGVGEQIDQYQDQFSALPPNIEEAASLAEQEATKISELNEIGQQLGEVGKVTEMAESLPDQKAIKEELTQKAQQQAIDHFQGKEEQLHKAMETLANYKQKYSKLEGLDQIPKKKPNAMRGKPFIERLVPGIALQIHRKDAWMVDFNLYAGYRFNARLTAGAGWNQRVAYIADEYEFDPDLRVYGPRFYGEFVIGQGFSGRLESEYMNTRLPPQFASRNADPDSREWVYSTMAGVKKEYRFLGKVKGTMMLLYNLHDPQHRSPYVDKLMVRFGFEFARKKATKH